jgi:aspartyl-tRNA synthetase
MLELLEDLTRTHYCGEIDKSFLNKEVILMGWVHKRRDLGGLIFIDLRDVKGIVQCVINPDNTEAYQKAKHTRNEYVIAIVGKVKNRDEKNINKNMVTGEIEVIVDEFRILNNSEPLPIQ